ncbi:MAG: hypothetical protein WEE53_13535 [Acidimicrobiia bacterium]
MSGKAASTRPSPRFEATVAVHSLPNRKRWRMDVLIYDREGPPSMDGSEMAQMFDPT